MKSRTLLVITVLIAVGLGGWAVQERHQRNELETRIAVQNQKIQAAEALISKMETDRPANQSVIEPEATVPSPPEIRPATTVPDESGPDKNPMSAMAKMMKDPTMRDAIKAQMGMQVDFIYRDFFDLLNLNETQQETFTQLLLDRTNAGMELGLAFMNGGELSAEEKKQKTDELKASNEASDAAIKKLLGEENYSRFERFEKSQPERLQLKTLNNQLKSKGIGLSEETESQLMNVMYQERVNFKYDKDLSDKKTFDPAQFTQNHISRFQQQQVEVRANILSKSGSILTPDQLEVFRATLEQQAAMEKMGMEMNLKMMGRGEEKK